MTIHGKLEALKNLSTKYAAVISNLLDFEKTPPVQSKKLAFVYSELKTVSGLVVLSLILESFGYQRYTRGGLPSRQALRYALITSDMSGEVLRGIMDVFNSDENKHGEYIQVLLASKFFAEGFTVKNIQQIHILTPWWNFGTIEQVIARGVRLFSHRALQDAGEDPKVDVYLHASVSVDGTRPMYEDSIDIKQYKIAEEKDVPIKYMEKILKEGAFDCQLNISQNMKSAQFDRTRQCEYQSCNYKCTGIDDIHNNPIDYSTYNLYYSDAVIEELIEHIKQLFSRKYFSLNLEVLREILTGEMDVVFREYELITALNDIISNNTIIYNKYGIVNFLRQDRNIFFLIENIVEEIPPDFNISYYSANPSIKGDFNQIKYLIKKICNGVYENILKLPTNLQEEFIEKSIIAHNRGIKKSSKLQQYVMDIFGDNIVLDTDGNYISTFLEKDRILKSGSSVWEDYIPEYKEIGPNNFGNYWGEKLKKEGHILKIIKYTPQQKDGRKKTQAMFVRKLEL